jgi:hypothetical protein
MVSLLGTSNSFSSRDVPVAAKQKKVEIAGKVETPPGLTVSSETGPSDLLTLKSSWTCMIYNAVCGGEHKE